MIIQYHMGQSRFHQVDPGLVVFPEWLVDAYLLGWLTGRHLIYIGNSNLLENFKVTQYFDNSWTALSLAGTSHQNAWCGWKTMCVFLPKRLEKGHFLKRWLEC